MKTRTTLLALVLVAAVARAQEAKPSTAGALDKSFNKTGKATHILAAGEVFYPTGLVVQSDGKVLGVGIVEQPGTVPQVRDGYLFRLTADGKPDLTFGVGGRVRTDLRQTAERLHGVALQKDGKIVTAGDAFGTLGDFDNLTDLAVCRYLANGALDPSFGFGKGFVFIDGGVVDQGVAVALQKDGKIVVTGATTDFEGNTLLVLVRLLTDGAPDPKFGTGGVVKVLLAGGAPIGGGVTIDKSKRILVGGFTGLLVANPNPFILRFLASGAPDKAFGDNGVVILTEAATPSGLGGPSGVQSDGKLIVPVVRSNALRSYVGAYRLLSNGQRDEAFAPNGLVLLDLKTSDEQPAFGFLLDKKNRILLAARVLNPVKPQLALLRLTAGGKLDPTFGKGGKQVLNLDSLGIGDGGGFTLQKDGRILVLTAAVSQAKAFVTRHLASN